MNADNGESTASDEASHEREYRRQFFAGNKLSFAQAFWAKQKAERADEQAPARQPEERMLSRNLAT